MKEGSRVGAISHGDGDTLHFFGYGVYLGDKRPSEVGVMPAKNVMGKVIAEEDMPNPAIRLDDGNIVWGCECWWGSEAGVSQTVEKSKNVVVADIVAKRKELEHGAGHRREDGAGYKGFDGGEPAAEG